MDYLLIERRVHAINNNTNATTTERVEGARQTLTDSTSTSRSRQPRHISRSRQWVRPQRTSLFTESLMQLPVLCGHLHTEYALQIL